MGLPAVGIVGWGLAVPAQRLTNDDLTRLVDTSDEWIFSRTGIRERHILSNGCNTSDLGAEAAQRALDSCGLSAAEIDGVVTATCTADMPFPSASCLVQAKLGIPAGALAMDLAAACSGYIYALVTGAMLVQTGRAKNVLVIGADAMSKIVDWQDRTTCVLFADGAGATVLRQVEPGYGLLGANLGSDGTGGELLKVAPRVDGTDPDKPYIQMAGREVFKFAVRIQSEACEQALTEAGLTAADIDWLVPHQANIRIIDAAAKALGIDPERVVVNLDRYGNTSAASIPLALSEAAQRGQFKRGDNILMVGFGAGLTWGAAVVRWV